MADLRHLGTDFDMGFITDEAGWISVMPYSPVDMQSAVRAGLSPPAVDLRLTSEKSALAQALIMRLMTERGELAGLGHPEYGSRHHALVGEPNNEANRNLIKLYMLECLRQEPRLDRIVQLDVKPGEGRENRDKVDVRIVVKFKALPDALILVLPFSFKGPLE